MPGTAVALAQKPSEVFGPFARMWPRDVFHCFNKTERAKILRGLHKPGVYILYRNDIPYYVGKADTLRHRLWQHANLPERRHYHFWNFFSAFVIEDPKLRNMIEGILIAAMPTANGAKPKLPRERIPDEIREMMRETRRREASVWKKTEDLK